MTAIWAPAMETVSPRWMAKSTAPLPGNTSGHMYRGPRPPGRGVEDLGGHSAGTRLAFAPVEEAIRKLDREMVGNNVKFRFIEHIDALRRRVDWPELATRISIAAEGP